MGLALVVDDTKNIRSLLKTCLELNNYEVEDCANGLEALEKLNEKTYELIFLDVKMPGMSGTELLKKIRAKGITSKVIMITAFATVKNAIECTRLGVVEYLHKPFTADKINKILNNINNSDLDKNEYILKSVKKLMDQEKYADAIIVLKKILGENPECEEVYELLATCYYKEGNHELGDKFNQCSKIFS